MPALREFTVPVTRPVREAPAADAGQGTLFPEGIGEPDARSPGGGPAADLIEQYKASLFEADIGITTADYAIADTGTLVLLSKKVPNPDETRRTPNENEEAEGQHGPRADGEQHRLISLVPPIHICLLDRSRIVANLTDLLTVVHRDAYMSGGPPLAMTFISGPSRTADIELTLTRGVHGPREVHVLLVAG